LQTSCCSAQDEACRAIEGLAVLKIGDRTLDDQVTYPDEDLQFIRADGKTWFAHKDGTPYQRAQI